MSGKNWSNLYFEVLKVNDELLARELSGIKANKDAVVKLSEAFKGHGFKKYIDAMADLRDRAVKADAGISSQATTVYGKIEDKVRNISEILNK